MNKVFIIDEAPNYLTSTEKEEKKLLKLFNKIKKQKYGIVAGKEDE
jgi:hypothetical protein